MYLVPHFHYDVAWIHTEEEEEKRGASLVKQFCDKARSDPQFKFILDQVPLLQAFMRQYPAEVSYLRQLTHGNIISLIDKDNGDEYEYCLGQVLGTTEDYSCTIKMYKGPVMTRLIAESKFTESNYISREVKLYSKAGPDIEWPDASEKGKHTFEYSL